jgi:4-carboxymuconolactone decarboxylase
MGTDLQPGVGLAFPGLGKIGYCKGATPAVWWVLSIQGIPWSVRKEVVMIKTSYPEWYDTMKREYAEFMQSVESLGTATRNQGPLDEKTTNLIQLAAAAAIHSEGAVHSHTKRALKAGATPGEVNHAIILLTSTIGFPSVSAALSWADDIIKKQ